MINKYGRTIRQSLLKFNSCYLTTAIPIDAKKNEIYITSYIPVQVCTFLQKNNNDMNRQKAEEKGIGREGSRHGQVKEIGRARK